MNKMTRSETSTVDEVRKKCDESLIVMRKLKPNSEGENLESLSSDNGKSHSEFYQ